MSLKIGPKNLTGSVFWDTGSGHFAISCTFSTISRISSVAFFRLLHYQQQQQQQPNDIEINLFAEKQFTYRIICWVELPYHIFYILALLHRNWVKERFKLQKEAL